MIIGLVGKNSAGKGEAANFLKTVGYTYYSLSDVIREDLKAQNKALTRDNLIEEGRTLRRSGGEAVLAERICAKLKRDQNYVIDSIRNPGEVQRLRREPNFFLVSITADSKVRFERMKRRAREGDPTTYDAFLKLEARESDASDPAAQQVAQTEKLADFEAANDSSMEAFHENLRNLLKQLVKKNSRPDWDQYFMEIARSVASRSNCVKRKVAAVLVRDRRIISSGYNGTPRGVRNCNEGGCPRCNSFSASGTNLAECLCSHAEENAIVQAAYHGVSVKGATIYTTFSPCLLCTKMILNSGIEEVVYYANYTLDTTALNLLKEAGVKVRQVSSEA